jgi:lipopolysaccharide biosynthesis glycosyltransferase
MSPDSIVFISVFNLGCIKIAENHLSSLKKVGIENYMAYVTDMESFAILTEKGYNVSYFDAEVKVKKEKQDFGTENFNDISYLRYNIINKLLKEGRTVWYLDVDTVVLFNLNALVSFFHTMNDDLIIQNDMNMPCTGCMLFFPNSKNIALTEYIYNRRTSTANDQVFLAHLLKEHHFDIKLHLLEPTHFPNGLLYFHERHPDLKYKPLHDQFKNSTNPVYFVHANWMVGVDTKIEALKMKGLWYL